MLFRSAAKRNALLYKYAAEYGIEVTLPNWETLVEERNKTEWIKANYPDGAVISQDVCKQTAPDEDGYGCETWTIGERRCTCGHVRLELIVEGEIGNWRAYPSSY